MSIHRVLLASTAVALLACAPGCFFDSDDDTGPPPVSSGASGFLTVDWRVDGSTDPGACDYWGADDMEMIIYDSAGYFYTEVEAPCSDFSVTIEMPEDTYTADVTLVDSDDKAISVTKSLEALRVESGSELVSEIDFTAESML